MSIGAGHANPLSEGEVRQWVGTMIPKHDPTANAIAEHYSGENYDEEDLWSDSQVCGHDCGGPPFVHPAARVAVMLEEVHRLSLEHDELVSRVVDQAVQQKQWTADMPWHSGDREMRIGEMTDSHLRNGVNYCRRRGMLRSMAALMIEIRRRQWPPSGE